MANTDVATVVVPMATQITLPTVTSLPSVPRGTQLRIPRSLQLQLARSLTFGVLGDDSQLYPSSRWKTENRYRFDGSKAEPVQSHTSPDDRKHNPQSKQIFHIARINKQAVCNVQSCNTGGTATSENEKDVSSVYVTSYPAKMAEPGHLIHRRHRENHAAEGIVPLNSYSEEFNVRSEMMLPVCDTKVIPSAPNPHRYLLRKRKVPPPFKVRENCTTHTECGGVYPNLEYPRMTSYSPGQTGAMPFENENSAGISTDYGERISISSLTGHNFSRRKYIQPPMGYIVGSFDGGVAGISSKRYDERNLPFMRAKTII